jgi:hypothetical protein
MAHERTDTDPTREIGTALGSLHIDAHAPGPRPHAQDIQDAWRRLERALTLGHARAEEQAARKKTLPPLGSTPVFGTGQEEEDEETEEHKKPRAVTRLPIYTVRKDPMRDKLRLLEQIREESGRADSPRGER